MARDVELVLDTGRTVSADESTDYIETEGGMLCMARAWFGAMSGTNPTCDIRIQASVDAGSNYYKMGQMQQLVGTDDNKELACLCYIPRPASGQFKTRVRVNYDVGGTTPSFAVTRVILEPLESIAPPDQDEDGAKGLAALVSSL